MNGQHTPGPWTARYDSYGDENGLAAKAVGTWCIGPAFLGGQGLSKEGAAQMEADARLIAAAPDMLAALQDIITSSNENCGGSLANAIQAAIPVVAKAVQS